MIVIKNVKKYFENGLVKALNGIDLEILQGEIVALMGPSGCGKSTLLNLIGAIDQPSEGEIFIDSKTLRAWMPWHKFRATMIGFVFQFHHLMPSLNLIENVELPLLSLEISRSDRRKKAIEMLTLVGLADRMQFLPTKVSGGERQRAAIARALINNPRIILADEPTGNLDTPTADTIINWIVKLCCERKSTLILATHNHEIAVRADRIIRMRDGLIE